MSSFYKRADHIEIMEMDHEWIVLDTEEFTITKINSMGAYILDMIKEHKKLDEIVEMIDSNYDVNPDAARTDALAFLDELIRVGLVSHERS